MTSIFSGCHMAQVAPLFLLLLLFNCTPVLSQNGSVNGFISFAVTQVVVDENTGVSFTTVQLPLVREVGSSGNVLATVDVTNSTAAADFFSTNVVVPFGNGVTSASATLILLNDAIPEGNETFIVQITSTRLGAEIGRQNTLILVVRANDEPYGQFQFDQSSLATIVSEPLTSGTAINLTVTRGPGVFGRVTVDFEVVDGPGLGVDDIMPTQGQLIFPDQSSAQPLTITITPDEVPERNETFTFRLSNPRGGATLSTTLTEAQLTIVENDTPIRFSQAVTQVSEDAGSVELTITRGLLEDGTRVGDTDTTTTIQLSTSNGTAAAGTDYISQNLTLTFPPGSISQTVSIPILNDSIPEGDETFLVILSNPSLDAVLDVPSMATVVILVNDNAGGFVQFASANQVVISEDDNSTGRFTLQRTVGTFSTLIVQWEITNNIDGSLADDDFQPPTGNVTIPDGQAEVVLEVQAFDDPIPEVAEGFMVRLVGVISGAGVLSDVGVRVAPLIITDSDDVYGLVEWAEDSRLEVVDTTPRELRLAVTRSGDSLGTIRIDYGIVYLPVGVTEPTQGDPSVVTMATGSVQLQGGQVSREFSVTISEDAFLEPRANFHVYLNSTTLIGGVTLLISPVASPRIGPRSQALVPVPVTAANGYTGFSLESLQIAVDEPLLPSPVRLRISRDGAYGEANVTWGVTFVNASTEDIGGTAGVETIPHGSSSADIELTILPDDLPEVNEVFIVQLLSIVPANQRIRTELNTSVVTIRQNDNAEGVFFISNSTQGPFVLEESVAEIIEITIEREGGALTNQLIQYAIPGGSQDLIGGFGFANFVANQRSFMVTILVNDDTVPEIDESFNFTISAMDGNLDILGSPTYAEITILANDDFAGVFLFAASSRSLFVDEPRNNNSLPSSMATFTIQRNRGTFTSVSVTWNVTTPRSGADISPTMGVVTFEEGQQSATFEIAALPDEIPEQAETFTVVLTAVSGDGRLALLNTEASLVIRQNDDPISFNGSSVEASEGDTVLFTIARGGQANDVAEVSFVVLYDTASAADIMVDPPTGRVVLGRGEREGVISVRVVEDEVPEDNERLRIQLTSTTGDAVIVPPSEATLLILPSDDPNGLFQFAPSSTVVTAPEGTIVQLVVNRLRGTFGTVDLRWTVYQLNISSGTRYPAFTSDLSPTSNLISFVEGNTSSTVEFAIMDDTLPELEEMFEVELSIAAIFGDSSTGARLGNSSIAVVVVPESDDPYGLFRIAEGSRMVEVAEDVPTDQPELGRVTVSVERTFGMLGDVEVTWEILPLVEPFPPFVDLFFFGTASPSVSSFPSRNDTGTVALQFSGGAGSIVTVPSQYHPTGINTGFAISLWLQPVAGSNGVLVAKTTGGGSTRFYVLALVADGGSFIIRLSYLPASLQTGFRSVEVSVLQTTLTDGSWHSLIVSVENGTAFFYVDGTQISSRSLEGSSIRDSDDGELTAGGLSTGEEYEGAMQDIRIYTDSLSESQIMALASDAAAAAITPTSGYLVFPAGVTLQEIMATSKDDSIPEPSQFFTVQLGNTDGGARIETRQNTASLTVLKSDAGNGIFGFDPLSLTNVVTEPGNMSLVVNRDGGTFDTVFVSWEIRELVGGAVGAIATQDFNPASGQLEFTEGVIQQVLYLTTVDELVPELTEDFTVMLVSAVANDNQTSSTPTSGASIDSSLAYSNITVPENDYPFGLIQFVTSPPSPGEQILPAVSAPEIYVDESDGTVVVYVVRAQGNRGTARAEYFTVDGTARSTGLQPDFVSAASTLVFGPSDIVRNFSLDLLDDSIPELGKSFVVNLTNPSGDMGIPGLSVGSTLVVNIRPSDDAFGRFGFHRNSLARVVDEQNGGTPVTLTVTRDGGTFGNVSVYWEVSAPLGDISPSMGIIEFAEGQVEGELRITVADDLDPELLEVFNIRLLNVSGGGVLSTGNTVSTVTIRANDHPYGRFVFSQAFRPLEVGEGVGDVEVAVTREFGTVGRVKVEFATIASNDLVASAALVGIDVTRLMRDSNIATTGTDYLLTSGALEFAPGETTKSFNLTIIEDAIPELSEYVFVAITSVELNTSSVDTVDPTVAPTLLPGNESLAFILISENDDARGVIQFTSSEINTTEPSQSFVLLRRTAGTFGEVSVQWEAVPTTASTSDYAPPGGTITFLPGVTNTTLPLTITDDSLPEFLESLTLRLIPASVSGGARVGVVQSTVVNILANDDPNGALEFAPGSRTSEVAEPDGSTPLTVTLTVRRLGGTVGVIQAVWNVTSSDGSSAMADILPVSGTLQFVSNMTQQDIVLSVLPDDIPEVAESFVIRLVSVDGGARIGDISTATVVIQSNDSPYGTVSFESTVSVVTEGDINTVAMVPVRRSLGTFGDLRVNYTVQSADAASLATADGTPPLDYFSSPTSNLALNESVLLMEVEITTSADRLGVCTRACLSDQACRSFASDGVAFCQLYLSTQTADTVVMRGGVSYYEKSENMVQPFYQAVATLGNDFTPTIDAIIIPEGSNQSAIPVTIIGDTTPELNESLIVVLTSVEVVGGGSMGGALLGAISETTVVIFENDDPHGLFYLVASNGRSEICVREPVGFDFGVTLRVERRGGTIGEVQVRWEVVGGSATEGLDFAGSGAVLTFAEGETRMSAAITILQDNLPERNEDLQVALLNPTGGATVAPGDGGRTLVVIEANDNAAGVVGLAPLSRSAVLGEGESVLLTVQRVVSALGMVAVQWEISGPGDVGTEFVDVNGTAVFEEGANVTEISIAVRVDSTPEVASPYTLTLRSVLTTSDDISPSGQATLDPQASEATITVRASDNPHGVVEFQAVSVSTDESSPAQLTIVRQFGTIGAIDVSYSAVMGNLTSLPPDTSLASPAGDFVSQLETVRLGDGQQSTVISIPIVDDSIAELNEVFLVRLTSVTLVIPQNDTIPPSIGAQGVSEVTITPNDSPQGEFTFIQESVTVEEGVGVLEVVVEREQGVVGTVSVVYLVTDEGATNGEDFSVDSLNELTFANGQSQVLLNITIVNDNLPEDDEEFCVRLNLPEGGAILGNITRMCVTITANDDAYGVFSFNSSSLFVSLQESQGLPSNSSVAELRVERAGGTFREVTVPFEVQPEGREDLSPVMGALVFQPTETFRIVQVEAIMDTIPELNETYTITLLPPTTLGRLATIDTIATITILANQDPYGVLEISANNTSSVVVEENVRYVEFEVRRTFGTFGEVSVTMVTTEGTAVAPAGTIMVFAATQLVDTVSAEKWLQFSRSNGQQYLVLASSSPSGGSELFVWRGAFTPVQTLSTVGARAFTFVSMAGGRDLLVAANGGSPGNREVNSIVYQFTSAGQLEVLQSIPTMGASDVVSFQTTGGDWYLVVANGRDNTDNPNVDSLVLRWNGTAFQQSQILSSIGASALKLFSISSQLYLAVTSLTDTRSQIFIWRSGQFRLDHTFDTQQAVDVEFIELQTVQYLAVASETAGISVLVWSSATQRFVSNATINATRPIRVEALPGMLGSFVVTNNGSAGQVFDLSGIPREVQGLALPTSRHLYPFTLEGSLFIAAAVSNTPGTVEQSIIKEQMNTDTMADFYPRNTTLTFVPGQSSFMVAIEIVNDDAPELNETFDLRLLNPMGGARLSSQSSVPVTILTNDDAHGVIGFAPSSQSVIIPEQEFVSNVPLEVVRSGGVFGRVRVSWQTTGEHTQTEVTPTSGEVVFADGASTATITLLIQPDLVPELNEVTMVTLTGILENGVATGGDPTRGARLAPPGQTTAVITVLANDAPHGVVVWSPPVVMVTEEEGVDSVVQLTLVREFGSIGAIIISYGTSMASGLPADQLAVPGADFLPTTGSVAMGDGETSTSINITILHDNTPELMESFLVTITDVQLANEGDRQGSSSDSPRTNTGNESVIVQITENDNSRGELSFAVTSISVEENAGSVFIPLRRTGGTFGTVGVMFTTTGVTATGGGVDFSPDSGSVLLQNGTMPTLGINITNDVDPELDEEFQVTLTGGLGGARIGEPTTTNVTILRNDDINGVFSFADNSLLFLIPEGQSASLTVQRTRNFVGVVTVYWEVASDGTMDLTPTRGNLTFDENVREQSFQVAAVTDGIPELFEAFAVRLVSADGGGRIVDPQESRIAIQSSNDPQGVVGFDSYPQGIIINEGDQLMVRMLRSGGVQGTVSVMWTILPEDSSVFVTTSDTVIFTSGQTDTTITVQTLSDSVPEVARLFSFQITSTSFVRADINASDIDIFVAASDSPHGVVQFVPPLQVDTQEATTTLMLPLRRSFGLVGPLRVNFSVTPNTAQTPEDFNISSESVIIPRDAASGSIAVEIINDDLPELNESFSILLQSVELTEDINGGRGFTFDRDPSLIDMPPSLGTNTRIEVTILQNDNPFGIISLTNTIFRVNEGETAAISLVRSEGTFGSVSIQYTIVNGQAIVGRDYNLPQGSPTVVFAAGQSTANILIPIIDDSDPELQEDFTIQVSLTAGSAASLGTVTAASVIIEASDSPFGDVGFSQAAVDGIQVSNPTVAQGPMSVSLNVIRSAGLNGVTQLTWSVTGPNPGREREDIDASTLSGILTLQNGQMSGVIQITVLPSSGPEPEERFIVSLTSASNNVFIRPNLANATIIVTQRGMPFGTIGFFGDALRTQVVDEEQTTHTFSLPLARTGSTVGTASVLFTVTRAGGGASPGEDVTPTNGSVRFVSGQAQASLELQILADSEPELNETFTVTLTGVVGGANLDSQATVSTFVIRPNDAPYGLFGLSSPLVSLSISGGIITRTLDFTITRTMGSVGSVLVQVTSTYDPDPSVTYVTRVVSQTFAAGVTEMAVSLPVTRGAYLAPDSMFTINITSATLASSTGVLADVSPTLGSTQAVVTERASNPQVGFDPTSVNATINDTALDTNVDLIVTRQGLLGEIQVSWTAGLPSSPLAAGSIIPSTGTLTLGPNNGSTVISLTATPRYPHGEPEVFAVRLSVDSLNPQFPARVDSSLAVTYIEPQGVVQLERDSYSGIEGREASITVWRRYGSMGDILVRGTATVAPSNSIPANRIAATAGADFVITPPPTVIPDGVTMATINISLPDNAVNSLLKVFMFTLTTVERVPPATATSPRLSTTNLSSLVTIIDDEGGAGRFQFSPTSPTALEGTPKSLTIVRAGGTVGRVTVGVRTSNGTTAPSATAGADYLPVDQQLTFESGQTTMPLTLTILDDSEPELTEYFTISLFNPEGGDAFIDPGTGTFQVAISENDNPRGTFSLSPSSLTLSEDSNPSGSLTITRDGGHFESVQIEWEALYTDGLDHPVDLSDILVTNRATLNFTAGQPSADINLQLRPNGVPASGEQFTVRIRSSAAGISFVRTEATVTAIPRMSAVFQFREPSRWVVSNGEDVTLEVQRVNGSQLTVTVSFATWAEQLVTVNQLTFDPAVAGTHFTATSGTLRFNPGENLMSIPINIIALDSTQPRAFYVNITVVTPHLVQFSRAVVLLNSPGPLSSLYGIYFNTLTASSLQDLESVTSDLLTLLRTGTPSGAVSGTVRNQSDTTRYIINEVVGRVGVVRTTSPTLRRKRYTEQLISNLLDTFQRIFGDLTFSQRSRFVQSLHTFADSLQNATECPSSNSEILTTYSRPLFYLEIVRLHPMNLIGRRFSSAVGNNFLQFPSQSIVSASAGVECVDVHYIEFFSERMFIEPTLNAKVQSISIRGQTLLPPERPIMYRVSSSLGVLPGVDDCLMWQYPSSNEQQFGSWERNCTPVFPSVLQVDYVECQCSRLGEFAVSGAVEIAYGWSLPAALSAALVMIVIIPVLLLHLCYRDRTQLATRILMCLCASIFLFELMILIDVFASDPSSNMTTGGCAALGGLLQFTAIFQFLWILALAIALWVNFMGFTDGREPLIIYVLVTCGTTILIVVVTILIGRFAAGLDLSTQLYGRNGDFCFMPLLSASLIATAAPVLITVLATTALLSHSCVYWSRWEDFHNIYHDSFNRTEIPLLLVLFVLVFLTSAVGYLHFYLREVYTFGAFVALNVIQGVFLLVTYFFVSCHTLTRKHKKYGINDEVEPLTIPGEPDYLGSLSTLASSRQQLIPEEEWEREDLAPPPPVVPLGIKRSSSDPSLQQDATEDSHLDDLMFMLKTQTYSPADDTFEMESTNKKPSGSERLVYRPISIADTHL